MDLLNGDKTADGKDRMLQLIGYGRIDEDALYKSVDQTVTLLAEDRIENNKCHFYELPIPESFWSAAGVCVRLPLLWHSPDIRTTRLDYRMSKLWFTLVTATSFERS